MAWRIGFALLVAYIAGFFFFVTELPQAAAPSARADAIVALTGGTERLDAATALFERGVGKRMLITGVHPSTSKQELKKLVHGGPRFDCCADLGTKATNTHGNATETAEWTKAHGYKSLIVVTASYHMPRSLTEFSAEMPGVKLVPYPVAAENIDTHDWWQSPVSFAVLQWEYTKYLGSLALTSVFSSHVLDVPHQHSHEQVARRV